LFVFYRREAAKNKINKGKMGALQFGGFNMAGGIIMRRSLSEGRKKPFWDITGSRKIHIIV
jgi:hypothetical protein